MPVTLLGARRRPRGDLTTKNNQSRYHENNYRRHNRHEGIPRLDCAFYGGRQRVLTRLPLTGLFGEPVAAWVLHLLCGNKADLVAPEIIISAFRQNFDKVPPDALING
jgi:hypothetical protein